MAENESGSDLATRVLELKRRALGLKREGKLEEAKDLLAQARDLELADVKVEDVEDPLVLKKLALSYKRRGLLQEAKAALVKAKALEAATAQETKDAAQDQARQEAMEAAKDLKNAGCDASTPHIPPKETPVPLQKTPVLEPSPPPPALPMNRKPPTSEPSLPPPAFPAKQKPPASDPSLPPPAFPAKQKPPAPEPPSSPPALPPRTAGFVAGQPSPTPPPPRPVQHQESSSEASHRPVRLPTPQVSSQHKEEGNGGDDQDNISETSDLQREYQMLLEGGSAGGEDVDEEDVGDAGSGEDDDAALLAQYSALMGEDTENLDLDNDEDGDGSDNEASPELTDEELLDVDTLEELMEIGEPLPSKETYDARALAHKQKALAFKRAGDLERAKAALRLAKQFEAAAVRVVDLAKRGPAKAGGDELDFGSDNDDENDDNDDGEDPNDRSMMNFSQEELADPDLLAEMISIGMKVPAPEDLVDKATALKREALQFKKAGDMENAKAKLRDAKAMEAQAQIIAKALRKASPGNGDDENELDVDIEAVLAGEVDVDDLLANQDGEKTKSQKRANVSASSATKATVEKKPRKTAAELKAEAIQFKKENKLPEAAQAFREYKAALAEEEAARAKAASEECARLLNGEAELADEQIRLFQFYAIFGRRAVLGKQQRDLWAAYARACRQAAKAPPTEAYGRSEKVALQRITNDLRFVETDVDVMDGDLHVSVVCLLQTRQIEALAGVPEGSTLRVDCTVGLPPSEAQSDGSISYSFTPASEQASPALAATADSIAFLKVLRLPMPRGETKYARMVLRRMPRKKAEFHVIAVPPAPAPDPNAGSFFRFRKATPPPEVEPVLLGKVVIDLKPLLDCNHIVGDFPLMGRSARRPAGGILRLAMRSGRPFSPEAPATIDNSAEGGAELQAFAPLDLSGGQA